MVALDLLTLRNGPLRLWGFKTDSGHDRPWVLVRDLPTRGSETTLRGMRGAPRAVPVGSGLMRSISRSSPAARPCNQTSGPPA